MKEFLKLQAQTLHSHFAGDLPKTPDICTSLVFQGVKLPCNSASLGTPTGQRLVCG